MKTADQSMCGAFNFIVLEGKSAHSDFQCCYLTGHRLDTLARMALWEVGLDYLHGTGHGIGSFLNVHEGKLRDFARARASVYSYMQWPTT